jgi:GT2 family glycosyltransferase
MKAILNKKIAVLITCHNRRTKTILCLDNLYSSNGLKVSFTIDVFLVDDGSTDGTSESIKENFPQVHLIKGNGELFWNRGMHLAWQSAISSGKLFDYFLWLNDDTMLDPNAILHLIPKNNDVIVTGSTRSKFIDTITYGGFDSKSKLILPNGEFQPCESFNGNVVLVPYNVYKIVGNLDPIFQHAIGDIDYGYRARKAGIKLLVAPFYSGICEGHNSLPKCWNYKVSVIDRFKFLYSPISYCNPKSFFKFDKRHNGIITAFFHLITIHTRTLIPRLWITPTK